MIEIIPNWHPIFVHFTVALLLVAAALHLLSRFVIGGELGRQLPVVARWNLRIGTGLTAFTIAAGWYAYYTVAHDEPSHAAMTVHRNWAMLTFTFFLGIAGWEYYLSRRNLRIGWPFTALLAAGAILLLITAWHGGELVYRYGVGVMSLPQTGAEAGHGHASAHEPHPHGNSGLHDH
ncbi:MAG TPA: DUF2231 domain-containing protein [Gallionella sp.]